MNQLQFQSLFFCMYVLLFGKAHSTNKHRDGRSKDDAYCNYVQDEVQVRLGGIHILRLFTATTLSADLAGFIWFLLGFFKIFIGFKGLFGRSKKMSSLPKTGTNFHLLLSVFYDPPPSPLGATSFMDVPIDR